MDRFRDLDILLKKKGFDGYLKIDSSDDPDMYYLSEFDAPDPFILFRSNGRTILLVSPLEESRAIKEARVDEVFSTNDFVGEDIRGNEEKRIEVLDSFLSKYGDKIAVSRYFSLYIARELENRGYTINIIEDIIEDTRSVKSEDEIEHIRKAQNATEIAMNVVKNIFSSSDIERNKLYIDGDKVTSEYVKSEIKVKLLRENCSPEEPIVACGKRGSDPHWGGSGTIRTGEPIVVDIFPRHVSGYYADMTRTFLVGKNREVKEMYNSVLEAQKVGLDTIESGVTGEEVHYAVCNSLENDGYKTEMQGTETGFIHSTGHGVGLSLHESPRLSSGEDGLKAGNVVTIEPGLYNPEIGGIRIEDLVVVKENGYENLTNYPKDLYINYDN